MRAYTNVKRPHNEELFSELIFPSRMLPIFVWLFQLKLHRRRCSVFILGKWLLNDISLYQDVGVDGAHLLPFQ